MIIVKRHTDTKGTHFIKHTSMALTVALKCIYLQYKCITDKYGS